MLAVTFRTALLLASLLVCCLQTTNYTLAVQTVPLNGGILTKYCVKNFTSTVKPFSAIDATTLDSSNCVDVPTTNKAY